jgi:hypothetical protein
VELESFDQWLKYVFDHPDDDRDWHFHIDDADWWDYRVAPAFTLDCLIQLFENTQTTTSAYSDAQIAHALWFIGSSSSSGYMETLFDGKLNWATRQRAFNAIYTLFENFFAKRCTPHLSHTIRNIEPPDISPLNVTCYMWWDLDWIVAQPNNPARQEIDRLALDIMTRTLKLPSLACQESALHGFGHWHYYYPKETQTIIDAFLKGEPTMNVELKAYALAARAGCVQ